MIELSSGILLNLSQVLYVDSREGEYVVYFKDSMLLVDKEDFNKIKEISTISANLLHEASKTIG